jgi:hypothetical protein
LRTRELPDCPLSHNDHAQKRPLEDALQNGFRSVEADIWLDHGDLRVAHLPVGFVGTLRQLYLEPLQEKSRDQRRAPSTTPTVAIMPLSLLLAHRGVVEDDGIGLVFDEEEPTRRRPARNVLGRVVDHDPIL